MSKPDRSEMDPHFIGWLKMPRVFARFLLPVGVGLVVIAAVMAGVVAWNQDSPGNGTWDDSKATTFEGIATAEPYAMIHVAGGMPQTVLLVSGGKFGAKERVRPFDGKPVRVSGTLLERDGVRMLELGDDDDAVRVIDLPEAVQPDAGVRRSVKLRGEIVDSKCYLGAMKPGRRKTHKGCAILCLRGGIPPLFVGDDGRHYLLIDADGGPLPERYFTMVGEAVEVEVELEEGPLPVLRLAAVMRQ